MTQQQHAAQATYDPNRLLDALIERLNLKNDGALSRILKVATPVIRNIRHGQVPVGASLLMWMHEATGISISELRALLGDRRKKCRLSCAMPTSAA